LAVGAVYPWRPYVSRDALKMVIDRSIERGVI
jgi:hypothetical protein